MAQQSPDLPVAEQHLEDFRSGEDEDDQYYGDYADLSVHRVMLNDRPRMTFYRECIRTAVKEPGKVVVDVGSGTGLLSCWAAKYGAQHTFSVEASTLAGLQPALFKSNNVQDKVTVLHCTVESLIDAGVDAFLREHPVVREAGGVHVLVSEWMGFYLFHEGMLSSVLRARDFFADVNRALGGHVALRLLPSEASLHVAPISLRPLAEDRFVKEWQLADDLDLSVVALLDFENTLSSASPLVEVIPPRCLLHRGQTLFTHDLHTLRHEELEAISTTVCFCFRHSDLQRDNNLFSIDGFVLWFDVVFGDCHLDTSPFAPPTHWKQTTMLLPESVREAEMVRVDELEDDSLTARFTLTLAEARRRCYTLEFELLENDH